MFKQWTAIIIFMISIPAVAPAVKAEPAEFCSEQGAEVRPVLRENIAVKQVPYSSLGSEAAVEKGPGEVGAAKELASALKESGFELKNIVKMIKNSTSASAGEISIICLSAGFESEQVHSALIQSGYTQKEANAAVPDHLRGAKMSVFFDQQTRTNGPDRGFEGLGNWQKFQEQRFQKMGEGN